MPTAVSNTRSEYCLWKEILSQQKITPSEL